ncbi:MAG: hypothetical protein HYS67_01045 [Deltaproteobacteria bacterium]|nr:hypothetical protein [Deltaproteobacteria bacterium]
MNLSVKSLTIAAALFWAGTVYKVAGTFGSVIVATLYALIDGAIGGVLFAWLYNCCAKQEN